LLFISFHFAYFRYPFRFNFVLCFIFILFRYFCSYYLFRSVFLLFFSFLSICSIILGAVHNIVDIDRKKHSDSEKVAFDFHVKKISAYGVENDIIEEIHKFPFPFQQLLIKEACAVMNRLANGKGAPGLTSLDCHCLFRNRYLLPCKHIFHEHMYGNIKLLTDDVWETFQKMFEESGFEVYEHRESVIEFMQTEQQKKAENRRLAVIELTERVRDRYWSVEEKGDVEKTEDFIFTLKTSLNPIIL